MSKELWFIRHTETVTPDSYNFDLSRKGRRDAQIIGWHMAQQELLPAAILHFDVRRANSMVSILTSALKQAESDHVLSAKLPNNIPFETLEAFARFRWLTGRMDDLAPNLGNQPPKTVVYIIHRAYEKAFDIFRYLLASEASKEILGTSDGQLQKKYNAMGQDFGKNYRGFKHGEIVRMRFPITSWTDIHIGSGDVIEHSTPGSIRPACKSWRRHQRALALQQAPQ